MALQTLNTIKQWFKTGFKPTQNQFWDTWDSFRHKFEKVPVKDVEGIDELLLSKADKTILDNHVADKNAHAPQVNTDWNSDSGFSQLLNKPEFKTINGEPVTGDGDIVIEAGGYQNLQTTLANGNETTNGIMFNDDYYNWLKTSIDSRSIRLTDDNSGMLVSIDSAGIIAQEDNQLVSLNPQGVFFNQDTAKSYLQINTASTGVSLINLPKTDGKDITLATTEDFKTVNGESIVGEGDIVINGESPGLQSVLETNPVANFGNNSAVIMGNYASSKYNSLYLENEVDASSIMQLTNQISFNYSKIGVDTESDISVSEFGINIKRSLNGKTTNIDVEDPIVSTILKIPAKSEDGKTYTIATTDDFKTINGESIVGEGDITIEGENSQTLDQVLLIGNTAKNKHITLLKDVELDIYNTFNYEVNVSAENINIGYNSKYMGSPKISIDPTQIHLESQSGKQTADLLGQWLVFKNDSGDKLMSQVGAGALQLDGRYSGSVHQSQARYEFDRIKTQYQGFPEQSGQNRDVFVLPKKYSIDAEFTLATTSDFKTINGQSIVGTGDITIDHRGALKPYTASSLPTGVVGDTAYITDATAPTYLGTLTGGGSIVCPVFHNGTAWVSH